MRERAGAADGYFYFAMSLVIAGVVAFGFGQTVDARLLHARAKPPTLVWIHAAIFVGWVLFYVVQSVLVRTRNVGLHRRLGWFGAGLGFLIITVGMWTAVTMRQFDLAHGGELAARAPNTLIAGLDIASFAVPFVLGIWWRRRPEYHRRLLLLASCGLCSAAFVRFPAVFHPWPWYYFGTDFLVAMGAVRDLLVNRRIHPVYLAGLPGFPAAQFVVMHVVLHYW